MKTLLCLLFLLVCGIIYQSTGTILNVTSYGAIGDCKEVYQQTNTHTNMPSIILCLLDITGEQ